MTNENKQWKHPISGKLETDYVMFEHLNNGNIIEIKREKTND